MIEDLIFDVNKLSYFHKGIQIYQIFHESFVGQLFISFYNICNIQ